MSLETLSAICSLGYSRSLSMWIAEKGERSVNNSIVDGQEGQMQSSSGAKINKAVSADTDAPKRPKEKKVDGPEKVTLPPSRSSNQQSSARAAFQK